MSEHTPQHHPRTLDPTAGDTTQTDLIAGDPPVPITVWRTAGTTADTGCSIGARLAARLIAAYSRPGEAVVDLTADHTLTTACTTGRRRHHPAWFTDACSLIIGPATPIPPRPSDAAADAENDVPELGVWFGDDLTDPQLPPHSGPVTDLPPDTSLQHATSLVVACWPLDDSDAANRVRLAWLLTGCARLLRPGGCLILVVAVPAGTSATPEDFTPVVQAAAGVGLGYLQHIVAVAADTDGDAFIYHVTDEELLALAADTGGQRRAIAHLRVHADLLLFSAQPAPSRSGPGGGRRG
jgi:SAM-dependent methyltransferase